MTGNDFERLTTQVPADQAERLISVTGLESPSAPALTIVYHPELRRIGERVILGELLVGREARISRNAPTFSPPSQTVGAPLGDPHLSRTPVCFDMTEQGGVRITASNTRTAVQIAGQRIDRYEASPEELTAGLLLQLADRVLLLMHWHTPRRGQADDLGLVGESAGINRVRDEIRRVADVDVTVLIRGQTGVGKELVASAIHRASSRRDHPLTSVNMAAIPASLAASELFGANRGAFTGAARAQDGYFRRADGSTLFLDEIGEVPVDVQIMLLRVLETGEVYPLGAQRPEQVDTRVIAATDADLEAMVEEGSFRAPLLHRLTGYEVWVPPLRERRDDISRLLLHFLTVDLAELGASELLDRPPHRPWLPLGVMRRIIEHDWPGNVRQLRNVARQLVIGNRGNEVAELTIQLDRQRFRRATSHAPVLDTPADGVPVHCSNPGNVRRTTDGSSDIGGASEQTARQPLIDAQGKAEPEGPTTVPVPVLVNGEPADEDSRARKRKPSDISEQELIAALRRHRWDVKATAKVLGISRTSLYTLIKNSKNIRTANDLSEDEIIASHREHDGDLDAMADQLQVSRQALRRRTRELGL